MKSKTASEVQYWINSALGLLSALLCGAFLVTLSIFFALWPITIGLLAGVVTRDQPYLILGAVGILMPILAVYNAIVSGRFLLRAAPPRLSGKIRVGPLVLLVLIAACLALVTIYLLSQMHIHLYYQILFCGSSILWLSGLSVLLGSRHLKTRAFLDMPFILYLRRFSTFSDRAVISVVLKASPPGVPVVFLTPTRTRAGDWNPFLIGFAGIKMRSPFRSSPIILRAKDEEWKLAAEELIRHAKLVIIDMSEGSDAIQTEIDLISKAARWTSTVITEQESGEYSAARALPRECEKASYLHYKKSWLSAMPRLIFGFLLMVCIWPLAWIFFGHIIAMLMGGFAKYGYNLEGALGNYRIILPLFLSMSLPYGYYSFFVRPSVSRQLSDGLKRRLQSHSL